MIYTVATTWRAKKGEEENIVQGLKNLTLLTRQEPGCVFFQAHISSDDPAFFFIYEQYRDSASYDAHHATPHFKHYVIEKALPSLESRELTFYETLDV